MLIVFISGPYRATSENQLHRNIQTAREHAIKMWQAGYAVICPHTNSASMGGVAPDEVFLQGDMAILRRCDAIYMLPKWRESEGAKRELEEATLIGLQVIYAETS